MERRREARSDIDRLRFPVSFKIHVKGQIVSPEVINYHYRGACLKVKPEELQLLLHFEGRLDLYWGKKPLKEGLEFRVCWHSETNGVALGIEFKNSVAGLIQRATRFETNERAPVTVTCLDPSNPNRQMIFKLLNISREGMALSTSLSNKFLLPGLMLKECKIQGIGLEANNFELYIQNTKRIEKTNELSVGVTIKNLNSDLNAFISEYLLSSSKSIDDQIPFLKLKENGYSVKKIKQHLTFKLVDSEEEYEKVLKIRHEGYKRAGKVKEGTDWKEAGDGLKQDGYILVAYLGGQIVGTIELRFSREHKLRCYKDIEADSLKLAFKNRDLVEVSKLVVLPVLQSTDIVLGLFQQVHLFVVMKGDPDVVMLATDKLVPLYKKLGGIVIGLKVPHSVLEGAFLNIMRIPKEVYVDGKQINALAWSLVYENTNGLLHEIGVTKRVKANRIAKGFLLLASDLRSYFTKSLRSTKDPFQREKKQIAKTDQGSSLKPKNFVEPKWTSQHVLANILLAHMLVAQKMIGAKKVDELLLQFGLNIDYFRDSDNWVSLDFCDAFLDTFSVFGSIDELQYRAGLMSISKEILGINFYVLRHLVSAEAGFKQVIKLGNKFNKTMDYKLSAIDRSTATIQMTPLNRNLVQRSGSVCMNWRGSFENLLQVITSKPGKVLHSKCLYKGDNCCEWQLVWTPSISKSYFKYSLVPLAILSCFWINASAAAFSAIAIFTYIMWLRQLKETKEREKLFVDNIEAYQKLAEQKYAELQKSKAILDENYLESKLLEEVHRGIQKSNDLKQILDSTLASTCTKFNFRRAFVMLTNADKSILETASLYGENDANHLLWQFKVNVSDKRNNPFVLSSVFHSSNSVLIQDVDEHKFQLSKESQQLLGQLKSKSFCMVAVPSEQGQNWGVIVADKGPEDAQISQRELVVIQRVAQSLGIALDKKAKFDSEVRLRQMFQKYVPLRISSDALDTNHSKLGGEQVDIHCMFIDIRGFTALSTQLRPQVLIDMLNRVFSVLQETVVESDGIIDKFLGDGALVTWRVTAENRSGETIFKSINSFFTKLEELNQKFVQEGLNRLDVGVGLHRGSAVVGNIGSEDRMEMTVIGSTVNFASRLESLCKTLETNFVFSSEYFDYAFSAEMYHYVLKDGVKVRGVNGDISVGVSINEAHLKFKTTALN
jgi:class 3 adenylate cyclase